MKCISRSTLGVVIGIINIVVYILASIGCIVNVVQLNKYSEPDNKQYDNSDPYDLSEPRDIEDLKATGITMFVIILVVCLVMGLISTLLVVGIVKKRHTLMAPWIVLSVVGFVCSCIRAVILIILMFTSPVPFSVMLYIFVIICLALGIQALIIYPIYTLYRDIRDKNNERPGQTIKAGTVGYTNAYPVQAPYYSAIPEKA